MRGFSIFIFLFSIHGMQTQAQVNHLLSCWDCGDPLSSTQLNSIGYSIDGNIQEVNGCMATPSIHVVILDSAGCFPLSNCNRNFGQANLFIDPNEDCILDLNTYYTCRPRPEKYFIYHIDNPAQMNGMAHVLDSTGNGNYILVFTFLPGIFSSADTSFRNSLQRLGSNVVLNLPDSFPFIFFCQKGDTSSVVETTGMHWEDTLSINATFACAPDGVEEITGSPEMLVFPNPAHEVICIKLEKWRTAAGRCSIYNSFGELLVNTLVVPDIYGTISVSTASLSSGLYLIQLSNSGRTGTTKICVEKIRAATFCPADFSNRFTGIPFSKTRHCMFALNSLNFT